ncbi:DUF3515 domain-containing protein [Rhodococcus indonesiensis]
MTEPTPSPDPHPVPDGTSPDGTSGDDEHRRSPALVATAVALPVALLIGIVVAAVLANRTPELAPVALGPVVAPQAESPECAALLESLPEEVGDLRRAELTDPAPAGAAAWQPVEGEPVVLRCGLERPAEFDQAAALQVVDGVQWFEVSGAAEGIDASTWFVVDRPVYVALTVPNGSGPTPLQTVSATITQSLPQQPIDPAPVAGG